jgi:hypothetical protein
VLLALLVTCPFEDLRDVDRLIALRNKQMADETGWFRYSLALASYWTGDYDQTLETVDRACDAGRNDAIGLLIKSMALAKLDEIDSARQIFSTAERKLADGEPILYDEMLGPCVVGFLRAEAGSLLSEHKGQDGANGRTGTPQHKAGS